MICHWCHSDRPITDTERIETASGWHERCIERPSCRERANRRRLEYENLTNPMPVLPTRDTLQDIEP